MLTKISRAYIFACSLLLISVTANAQINPPYTVGWVNQIGVSTNGDILTKTSPVTNWITAGGISSNVLSSNTDGWMEFSGQIAAHYVVGLAANNAINLTSFSNGLLLDHANNSYSTYEGSTVTNYGGWQPGDVFRISREGSSVKYYRNGALVRSVTVNPALVLKVKASIYSPDKSTSSINTSFDAQIIVQGSVTGIEGGTETGSISLAVSGATAPYSYSWSSGEQTSAISNKAAGAYSVTVSDAAGRQQTRTYSIGYKWSWLHQVGASANEGILTKTSPVTTWPTSGAISTNTLPANTDGWMEFSGSKDAHYIIGFGVNNIIDLTDFSNAILIDYASNSYSTYEGATAMSFGAWQTGDVFRISREGTNVKYYRNGMVVRSVTVNPELALKIKTSIQYIDKTTPPISTSFDKKIFLLGSVVGIDGSNGVGNISVLAGGGTPPYSYNWSSGEQSSAISNKSTGTYTLTVSDAVGREQARTYEIGHKIFWMHQVGVSANNDILTKISSSTSWPSGGGISSNVLPSYTDGWMEFSGGNAEHYMIGLATNNIINQTTFNNAIFINYSGNSYTTYEGTTATSYGNWQLGDVFRISREGNTVKYYRNGTVFRSVSVNPALVLKVVTSIQLPGKTTPIITTSFEGRLFILGSATGLEGNSGSGGISLIVGGGTPPYTYAWSSGEQTGSVSNKPKGLYTVAVNDAVGRQLTRTYNIGNKVTWLSPIGVSVNDNILTKTSPVTTWTTAGGVSSNLLRANTDGWIEFSGGNAVHYVVGLAASDAINLTSFNNAILVDYSNNSYTTYEGATATGYGNWQLGDVFRISREGNSVKYYRNGVVVRSVSVDPTLVLKVKTSIQQPGKSSPIINTSFWTSDGVIRIYYSIADGNWTTPATWSLSENGPPSTVYPDDIDKVVIKGHEVTISSPIKSSGIAITSTNENTRLKVDGNMAALEVKGNIVMNRENNSNTDEVLLVQNNGKLDVK